MSALITHIGKGEPRVDTRRMADHLGVQHASAIKLVRQYFADMQEFGTLRFEIAKSGGRPTEHALLNEDQAYLLLTFSKNTPRVRSLKVALVKAFKECRLAADLRSAEYLPTYHDLHDQVAALAEGSENAKFVHMNFNKLVNNTVGIGSGERDKIALPQRSLLVVAQGAALNALRGAKDHKEGYANAKGALTNLSAALGYSGKPKKLGKAA